MPNEELNTLLPGEDEKALADVPPPEQDAATFTGAAIALEEYGSPGGSRRWLICGLLFAATTINYLDRSIIGILSPTLNTQFHWSKADYSYVTAAFQIAYAIGMLVVGGFIDKVGTRKGFAIAAFVWSLAAMCTGLAHFAAPAIPASLTFGIPATAAAFIVARFMLGIAEAGNFPAAVKTVAEWFPKKERALATGWFNAGSNVGAILAPATAWLLVVLHFGWEWAFIVTGAVGFLWVAWWLAVYRKPADDPKISTQELAYIMSDPEEPVTKIPWAAILPYRQTWAFALGKFLTDPVWWFWLFWLGIFLKDRFHVELKGLAAPLVVIYVTADVGSVAGGWLSSSFIKQGWPVNTARKTTMLICALCVVPVIGALFVKSMWTAVGLISLAAAAHQAWSANLFTLVSDTFPRRAVGSVVGFGGMLGGVGGVFLTLFAGDWLKGHPNSYLPIFFVAGFGYLLALAVIHLLAPRLEPVGIDGGTAS